MIHVYPAIDLLDQKVVRLYQGDYEQRVIYGEDPVAFAKDFEKKGAKYLHLVDLNGAKDGKTCHFEIIKEIVKQTNLFVEIGGGIRDEKTVQKYLDTGINRVIIGTLPQKNPKLAKELVEKYQEKMVVGVDARHGKVAVEGWLETTDTDAFGFCQELASWGVRTIIFTEISRDGTNQGVDIELYQKLLTIPNVEFVASGGVSSLKDIQLLKELGVPSVIVGKALYENRFTLEELLKEAGGDKE